MKPSNERQHEALFSRRVGRGLRAKWSGALDRNMTPTVGTLIALTAALALTGCAHISGHLEPARAPEHPAGHFQAGASRVDITPLPGYPMGGHSLAGRISRGTWTRLYARSLYFEDGAGQGLALVSCDLWSIPAGLADRVVELVQRAPGARHLGRDQLVLAATHTHQSPGNYSSSSFYNEFASRLAGFDPRLFEFLARNIADGVIGAVTNRQRAELRFAEQRVPGLMRNRSFEAFTLNPESRTILGENHDLPPAEPMPEFPEAECARAVNPVVSVLRAETECGEVYAAAFLSVHPTVMSHRVELYQSDIFGVAATLIEKRFGAGGTNLVLALFNGAEGDQSAQWRRQDRLETLRLGGLLATNLASLLRGGQTVDGPIRRQFARCELQNRGLVGTNGIRWQTADQALAGAAMMGGAEDGRSFAWDLGWKEGVRGPNTATQGAKQPALDPVFLSFKLPFSLTRLATQIYRVPHVVPLGVYSIGPIVCATLPGEFTTTLGRRIAEDLAARCEPRPLRVLLIGPANEYVSYFTTPEEYAAQHYEGASTLYGPASGPLVGDELRRLAADLATPSPNLAAGAYRYATGSTHRFDPDEVGARPLRHDDGLEELLLSERDGRPLRDLPHFEWRGPPPRINHRASTLEHQPRVGIEVETTPGSWSPLLLDGVSEDDTGLNLVTVLLKADRRQAVWSVIWMPPASTSGARTYRFAITAAGRAVTNSPSFTLGSRL